MKAKFTLGGQAVAVNVAEALHKLSEAVAVPMAEIADREKLEARQRKQDQRLEEIAEYVRPKPEEKRRWKWPWQRR